MSNNQQRLLEAISLTAAYYNQVVPDAVIMMYANDLEDLPIELVIQAYSTYRKNPKNRTVPLPAMIREIIEPSLNPEAQGREISARVSAAVTKFGYSNPTAAKLYIGPIGWKVIDDFGGWSYICENLGVNIDVSVFKAQTRERAKDLVQSGASLEIFDRPQLDSKEQPKGLQPGGDVLKQIMSKQPNRES